MAHFGSRYTLLERVFNKTRSLAQSLYARARTGIVYLSILAEMDPKTPQIDPQDVPIMCRNHRHHLNQYISPLETPEIGAMNQTCYL